MRGTTTTAPPRLMITSSPKRVEKLAMPPFKLLKGKGGSRSRRRSPLFATRTTRSGSSMQEGKEPSSPKVTCIGQVRIRKKEAASKTKTTTTHHHPPSPSCCKPKSKNPSNDDPPPAPSSTRRRGRCSMLMWWFSSLCSARCKERNAGDVALVEEEEKARVVFGGLVEKGVAKEVEVPTNALLLMRCRSAPYRASLVDEDFRFEGLETEKASGAACGASLVREAKKVEEASGGVRLDERDESSDGDTSGEGDARLSRSLSSRPLMLTRCKSEPPRRKAAGGGGGGNGIGRFDGCGTTRTSLTSAAEVLPFGLLQSTFRL